MEWAAPTVLALKQDGSLRYGIDWRSLNAVTVLHSTAYQEWIYESIY